MGNWTWEDLNALVAAEGGLGEASRLGGPQPGSGASGPRGGFDPLTETQSFNPADNLTAVFDLSEEFFSNILRDPAAIAATGWKRGNRHRDTQLELWEPFLSAIENPELQEFMRGIAGRFATGLSLPALVMEPGPAEFGVVGKAAMDALPLLGSLFPASKMAWNAPVHLGWQNSLQTIFKHGEHWDPQFRAQAFIGAIHDHMPSANLIDDGYIKIASRGGTIEVAEHGGNVGRLGDALEIYINGNVDPDDIARFIDLADAGGFSLITGGKDAVPYALAHRLGFVEESLGGGMIRMPVPDDAAEWYVEMTQRLGGDSGGELFRASGLKEGDMVDELSVLVHRNTDLSPGDRGYWIDRILEPNDGPNAWEKLINDMTDEGIIPRIPGEDFVSRNMDPPPLRGPTDDAGRRVVGAGGFNPGNYDADDLADWAAKIKRAQEDAIRRGSPYTTEEWARFLDVEGVRMPDGSSLYDEAGHLRPAARDAVARLQVQFSGNMGLPVELSDAQVAGVVSSEFGLPVSQNAIRDADQILHGLHDSMDAQLRGVTNMLRTATTHGGSLPEKMAGDIISDIFAIRPEDLGRQGDVLVDWFDGVQRSYNRFSTHDAPDWYNVQKTVERGLADLKVVANTPNISGNTVENYDLLIAVRQMGDSGHGHMRNLFDVVDDLHKFYPTIPLEKLQSIVEMALL